MQQAEDDIRSHTSFTNYQLIGPAPAGGADGRRGDAVFDNVPTTVIDGSLPTVCEIHSIPILSAPKKSLKFKVRRQFP